MSQRRRAQLLARYRPFNDGRFYYAVTPIYKSAPWIERRFRERHKAAETFEYGGNQDELDT